MARGGSACARNVSPRLHGLLLSLAVHGGLGRIYSGFARAVRTWKYGTLFLCDLVSGSHVFSVWVLHAEHRKFGSSGDLFLWEVASGRILYIFYDEMDSNPVASSPFSRRMEKCAQQMPQIPVQLAMRTSGFFLRTPRGWQLW